MKIYLLSIILLIATHSASAQQKQNENLIIVGRVLTADGLPASGLLVSIKDSKEVCFTQNDGYFKISSPSGNKQLPVKSGISTFAQNI